MPTYTCPICGRTFQPRPASVLPFCSGACQEIDLSRWLGEQYRLPLETGEGDEPGESEVADHDDA
jgi:endogenous inhibitor of DNA gyrase (YacG/DUF329 family)